MSMALLFPLGLLALAAWLVPLLVHLARRQQYTPLDFAALRWLQARMRPRQRVRFDEWLLLLVRMLLLAALAVLLARPVLHGLSAPVRPVVVVAPGLDASALRTADDAGDWRWLAPGFPALRDDPPRDPPRALASLLRELDQQLPAGTPLTVFVPEPMRGLDGQRVRLSRAVDWRAVALPVAASAPDMAPPRLHVGGHVDATGLQVLGALQQAWSATPLQAGGDAGAAPAANAVGVWLQEGELPAAWQAWLRQGGTLLAGPAWNSAGRWIDLLHDDDGRPVLQQHEAGDGRVLRFTAPLSPATLPVLREASFAGQLLHVLRPSPAPTLAAATSQQPLAGAAAPLAQPRDLAGLLAIVVVLLFALERWLATSRGRGGAA